MPMSFPDWLLDHYTKILTAVVITFTLGGLILALLAKRIKPLVIWLWRGLLRIIAVLKGLGDVVDRFPALSIDVAGLKTVAGTIPVLVDRIEAFDTVAKEFPEIAKSVRYLHEQYTPNGGGAFIDTVNNNAKRLTAMSSEIRQHTAILHLFSESMEGAVVVCNGDGVPNFVSMGFTQMTGLDLAAMQNDGWHLMIHPEDIDRVVTKWEEARGENKPFVDLFRVRDVHNAARGWFKVHNVAMPIDTASTVGWKSVFTRWAERIEHAPIPGRPADLPLAITHEPNLGQ